MSDLAVRTSAQDGPEDAPTPGRHTTLVQRLLLLLIVVVGTGLRLARVGSGLPTCLHPDEWVVVGGAADMANRNSFEPPYFVRPDQLEMKAGNLAYLIFAHLVRGTSSRRSTPPTPRASSSSRERSPSPREADAARIAGGGPSGPDIRFHELGTTKD